MNFSLNRQRIGKKMMMKPTCSLEIYDQQQWSPVRMGLDFLNTFLSLRVDWSSIGNHKGIPGNLVDLSGRLESAFDSSVQDIEDAAVKGDPVEFDVLLSSLVKKIDHFKPQVRDAYNLLSLEYTSARFTVIPDVYDCLLSNCQNLYSTTASSLSISKFNELEGVLKFLQNSPLQDVIFRRPERFHDLYTKHGGLCIIFARLLFLCWADGVEINAEIPDLVWIVKPTTPLVVSMYYEVIASQYQHRQRGLIEEFVGIITLLFPDDLVHELRPLCDCLVFLIEHLLKRSPNVEVEAFISDAASHSSWDELGGLIHKGELLRIRILLMELGDSDTVSKARFKSVYQQQGPEFYNAYPEKIMLILRQMEMSICREDSSNFGDILHDKVRLTFYLTENQAFLMELMSCNSSLIVVVKDEIEMLIKGSKLFQQQIPQYDPPEEFVVALSAPEAEIIDLLFNGGPQLYLIGIVGMPGIGKTTFAKKVYSRPDVKTHFKKIAWCRISQYYRMRELLLQILSCIDDDIVGKLQLSNDESDEQLLIDLLRWNLKGNRYFIVMDDMWQEEAWRDFNRVLPRCINGSRILFTGRTPNIFSFEAHLYPLYLRLMSCEEIWQLLERRVFGKNKACPVELIRYGSKIAERCSGLPLLVVAVAGLLRKLEPDVENWKRISKHLNSHTYEGRPSQIYRIFELIYNHLPDHLKPCLLYFVAFEEDQEIPVKKLIRFWRAEGFIRNQEPGEDVALGYLEELIDRNLVIAVKRGSNNQAKSCKILNQLHHFCFARVKEDNFFRSVSRHEYEKQCPSFSIDHGPELMPTPSSIIVYDTEHRLRICSKSSQFVRLEPCGQSVRTLLFAATSETKPTCTFDVSFIPRNFPLLRVLDIESLNTGPSFLEAIQLPHPLRYLAVGGDLESVPSTIEKLHNLETFIVTGLKGKVRLPTTIWNMPSLRDLQVSSGAWFNNMQDGSPSQASNLLTLSSALLSKWTDIEDIMKKAPQLKKLRCIFSPNQLNSQKFVDQQVLLYLESLKVLYNGRFHQLWELSFPSNLNNLSLNGFGLTWECISSIAKLDRLEALTLGSISFNSLTWAMGSDDKFPVLKILKLDSLLLLEWCADSENFPSLKRLVMRNCKHLQEVPPDFVCISTLEMIELKLCSRSAEMSVKGYDNVELKINAFQ